MATNPSSTQQNVIPEINGIKLTHVNNGAHYQFIKTVAERAAADTTLTGNTFAQNALTALTAALTEEDRCLQLSRKSLTTDDIKAADTERDRLYSGLRAAVKGFLRMPAEEMAQAARKLNQAIKDYGISPQMQLERETGLITNLVADCEQKYSGEVTLLGLTPYVTALKAANQRVEQLLQSRNDEYAAQTAGAMRLARNRSDEAYRQLARVVNAMATLGQADALKPFIDSLNTLIKRYKEQVIASPTPSEGGQTDTTGPTVTDENGTRPVTSGTGGPQL